MRESFMSDSRTTSQMAKTQPAPLSPRLSIYRWQWPMVASLAHRASGIFLITFMLFFFTLIWLMSGTPQQFEQSQALMHSLIGKLIIWLGLVSLVYHWSNGVRFLLLDAGFGESREMMRLSARVVIVIAVMAALLLGGYLL